MKKVIDISIASLKFSLEEDAYTRLKTYLDSFERSIDSSEEREEIMEDVKFRIAEILQKEQQFSEQVINMNMIQVVIGHLGEIDETEPARGQSSNEYSPGEKKIYREVDDKKLAGVCAGFATYFNIDPTIIRILFVLLVIFFGTGIFAYIILWVVIPKADTISKKLQLRGLATSADNIRKFTEEHKHI